MSIYLSLWHIINSKIETDLDEIYQKEKSDNALLFPQLKQVVTNCLDDGISTFVIPSTNDQMDIQKLLSIRPEVTFYAPVRILLQLRSSLRFRTILMHERQGELHPRMGAATKRL